MGDLPGTYTGTGALALDDEHGEAEQLALVGGLSIERAVSAGRIAAYNVDPEGRDWGVPVLYLRAADGRLFEGAPDEAVRQQARTAVAGVVHGKVVGWVIDGLGGGQAKISRSRF